MKLTILERVTLLQVLPSEGDFVTLKILRGLRDALGFSEADHKKYDIVQKDGRITWDRMKGIMGEEVEIGDKAKEMIKESLLKLDKEKKLRPEHFDIYQKFVQEKGDK